MVDLPVCCRHYYVIPVFVWVLTLAIVFGLQLIQPIISVLTFIKGSVLLATVSVCVCVCVCACVCVCVCVFGPL